MQMYYAAITKATTYSDHDHVVDLLRATHFP